MKGIKSQQKESLRGSKQRAENLLSNIDSTEKTKMESAKKLLSNLVEEIRKEAAVYGNRG